MTEPIKPTHHPSEARLLDYASGSLAEPMALLVATHLAFCTECRQAVRELESLGGLLLDELDPEPVGDGILARMMARIDHDDQAPKAPARPRASTGDPRLPQPLRDYVGTSLHALPWRRFGPIGRFQLLPESAGMSTRLFWIRAGAAMPSHTHDGSELTLVLKGAFHDGSGHYARGDVAEADSHVDHRPIADRGEDCFCLAVTDAPLKLTGTLGRFVNPFVRI